MKNFSNKSGHKNNPFHSNKKHEITPELLLLHLEHYMYFI